MLNTVLLYAAYIHWFLAGGLYTIFLFLMSLSFDKEYLQEILASTALVLVAAEIYYFLATGQLIP